jgi:hypothetical protein
MHRITLNKGIEKYSIDIQNIKYLIGDNQQVKFNIYQLLKGAFSKAQNSEYAIENNLKHSVYFDDKPFDLKFWRFFEVSSQFDLENDMKMGSKSLVLKYLESFSEQLERCETFTTLSLLAKALNEEFFEVDTILSFNDKRLSFSISDIPTSVIFKECAPTIRSDDLEMNYSDLSYEDIILFQLEMIFLIAQRERDKNAIVFCTIPVITTKISEFLMKCSDENLYLIVETRDVSKCSLLEVLVCSRLYADFANEELLLDIIMDLPFHIQKNELLEQIDLIINNGNNDKNNPIYIAFFPWKT